MTLNVLDLNGLNGFVTVGTGPDAKDVHGISVVGVGDVNGDGIDDFVVGSDGGDNQIVDGVFGSDLAGRSHLVFGTEQGFPAFIDLAALDGTDGVIIPGPQFFAQAGFRVGAAGDINNDGFDDIIIGAPNDDITIFTVLLEGEVSSIDVRKSEGAAYVIYGREDWSFTNGTFDLLLDDNGDLQVPGAFKVDGDFLNVDPQPDDAASQFFGEQFGFGISRSPGDINGDGFDDIIVGSKGDRFTEGKIAVVFGRGSELDDITTSSLNGANGFLIRGKFAGGPEQSGRSVTFLDMNGDGISDLAFGAPVTSDNGFASGTVHVVFGGQSFAQGSYNRTDIDGANGDADETLEGLTIVGRGGTLLGWSIDNAGDVNGDGIEDLLIGSPGSNGFASPGEPNYQEPVTYLIWGKEEGLPNRIDLNFFSPEDGVRIIKGTNTQNNIVDEAAEYVGGIGDVNGDGFDDVAIGTNYKNRGPGFVRVLYGSEDFGGTEGVVRHDTVASNSFDGFEVISTAISPPDRKDEPEEARSNNFGAVIGRLGDINNDGADDFAIGETGFTGDIQGNVTDASDNFADLERGKTSYIYGVQFEQLDRVTAVGDGTDAPTITVSVTVSLTAPALNPIEVQYQTVDGSAVAGSDFAARSGSLSFSVGQQSKTIELQIFGNDFIEGDEQFGLNFFNARGAGFGDSTEKTVIIDIPEDFNIQNLPPTANDDAFTIVEDTTLNDSVVANDTDPDQNPLTATVVSGPQNGELTLNPDGTFTYVPDTNFDQSDSFTYEISDGLGGTDQGTVFITVTPVNDAPLVRNDGFLITEDDVLTGNVRDNNGQGADADPEGDAFTYSLALGPENGVLTFEDDGSFEYTPDQDFNGQDEFTYRATDALGAASTATVTITIDDDQDAPTPVNDSFVVDQDDRIFGNVLADNGEGADFDVDGDRVTARLLEGAENGQALVLRGGVFYYRPDEGFFGTDSFTYQALDEFGNASTATVSLEVTPSTMVFDTTVSDESIQELDDGVTNITFTVERIGNSADVGTIDYELVGAGSSPLNDADIIGSLSSGTLTFAEGETSKTFTIGVLGDLEPEETELVTLSITNAQNSGGGEALIGVSSVSASIINDDEADIIGTPDRDNLKGTDREDTIFGDLGDDRLRGRDDDDILIGGGGDDYLRGDDADDLLLGGPGNDRLDGGDGYDTLNGGLGDDDLFGGDGEDVLRGGGGNDRLTGGKDNDIFVYTIDDNDVLITDFDLGEDMIDFTGMGPDYDTLDKLFAVAEQESGRVVFDFGLDELTIDGVRLSDLQDSNVILV